MKTFLFIIAILLMIGWGLGFFLFNAGMLIHMLIIVAAISCMRGIMICPPKEPVSQ